MLNAIYIMLSVVLGILLLFGICTLVVLTEYLCMQEKKKGDPT